MGKLISLLVNLMFIRWFLKLKYVLSDDITEFAINEGFIFSDKSLKLVECTYEVIPRIIRGIIGESNPNNALFDNCLNNGNFKRSLVGLAISFGSGKDLEYDIVKCPRIIAAFQRDRILGYSCPYLSKSSELFNFYENKELKNNVIRTESERHSIKVDNSNKDSKLPTILTSIYRKLLQSCDMIKSCLNSRSRNSCLDGNCEDSSSKMNETITYLGSGGFSGRQDKLKETQIKNIIKNFPKKIGRMNILNYSNELLRRVVLEYEISTEKISPFDPFWLIQAYRMLLIYSVVLEDDEIFVNINSYYFKRMFNYLVENQPLRNIDSLQLKTKYMSLDDESKKQLLFLRASYTILESCFKFWEDLHDDYVSKLLSVNENKQKKNKHLDFSQICQYGFQLPLRQTKIFFYYAGIKVSVKYSDSYSSNIDNVEDASLDSSCFTELSLSDSEKYNWYDTSSKSESDGDFSIENAEKESDKQICSFCTDTSPHLSSVHKSPWFTYSTNLFFPISTVHEYLSTRNKEISSLISQSLLINNPKATVLNLDEKVLSGYYIGGTGSMMYKSCKYYLKKLHKKKGGNQILLAHAAKLVDGQYRQINTSEKIKYFCWNTAKIVYPNDKSFDNDYEYNSEKYIDTKLEVFQSKFKHESPLFLAPKKMDHQGLKELDNIPNYSFSSSFKGSKKQVKELTFLEERRNDILRRLHPQDQEIDLKSLAYSISDKNYELEKIPIIKKYSAANFQYKAESKQSPLKKSDKQSGDTSKNEEAPALMPKLLQEIRSGIKLKPTGSLASREIMENVRREITSDDKNENLGISSSQIKEELQNSEFAPPVVQTALLDEVTSNNKILFEIE